MKWNLKKMWPLAAASLCFFTSVVQAGYDDAQMRNLENRVSALEQRKNSNGMINPPGRPQVRDGADLFIMADFLYWKARENGLEYVLESGNNQNLIFDNKIVNPTFKWHCGFRVGIGYNLPHDGWDIRLLWTRIVGRATDSRLAPLGGALIPVLQNPQNWSSNFTVDQSTARLKIRLNMLDLEMGREFFVSKWMTLRPFFGIRSAWIPQRFKTDYKHANIFNTGNSEDFVRLKNKFWGMGLRGGMNAQWGMGAGWSLYSDLAASLMIGRFKTNVTETLKMSETTRSAVRENTPLARAILDIGAGLRWEYMLDDDRFHIAFQAGWEQHIFFGQNQLPNFVDNLAEGKMTYSNGDLTYDGLTISGRFDF